MCWEKLTTQKGTNGVFGWVGGGEHSCIVQFLCLLLNGRKYLNLSSCMAAWRTELVDGFG